MENNLEGEKKMKGIYYALSLISGLAIATQVAVNGKLRSNIGDPILTSFISFAVGAIGLAVAFFASIWLGVQAKSDLANFKNANWWMWTGGLFGAFYIFTTIFASPKIGFANMFSLVIAGQIILAVIFDHFGAFNMQVHAINPLRAVGIILLVAGVYIIQTH